MIEYFNPKGDRMARRLSKHSLFRQVVLEIGWMIGGVIVLVAVGLCATILLTPGTGYLSPLLALLLLVTLAMLARNIRRGRALVALEYVNQAVRLNLPLPQMLAAAEAAEQGVLRRRLARLRDQLEDGAPVAVALQEALPGLPPRAFALVQSGERLGRLPHALGRAARQERTPPINGSTQAIFLRWYPVAMLTAIALVTAIVVTFLIPKYIEILRDFQAPIPAATQWIFTAWNSFELPLAIVALLGLLAFCGRMLSEAVPIRRPLFGPVRHLVDRIAWTTPLWRGSVRNSGLADVCFVLADALDAGQSIDRALLESADAATNVVLRNRVNRWAQLMSGGADVAQSARAARMPAILWGMLAAARGPEGTRNVLLFLGRYYDTRFSAAAALLRAAAVPVMVGITATLVTIIALGVFMPMIRLAEVLMRPRGVL